MIYKGIVESVNNTLVKVRIPCLDKGKEAVGSVTTGLLGDACICTLPGVSVHLHTGDVVFVDFEDTLNEAPVIIGTLYGYSSTSRCNMSCMDLNVSVTTRLPKDTEIGDIKYTHLNKLTGITYNIQNKFDELTRKINEQNTQIEELKQQIEQLKYKQN